MHEPETVQPAPEAIKAEFRALARVVHDALMMIVKYLRSRYLS